MRLPAAAVLVAIVGFSGARLARSAATEMRGAEDGLDAPYTPSTSSAPFVSLGYREAFADLLYVRLRGYYGAYYDTKADVVASLTEAIVTLDPRFERVYEFGAGAMTIAPNGVDQSIYLRSIAVLEKGIAQFPQNWGMPLLAGQTYIQDLKTEDEAQRRTWDERGVLLVESAIRKPGAPAGSATWAAHIRSKLGQHDRAVQGLRELILTTNDDELRKKLIDNLAKLEQDSAESLASEVLDERAKFERRWKAERPSLPPTMYLLLGAAPTPGPIDPVDLATGGLDLVGSEEFERLEPVE